MSKTITVHGRTYTIGAGHQVPVPLPDFLPRVLPPTWQESRERWGASHDYGRVYRKPGEGLLVLVSCAEQGDGKRWLHVSVSRRDHKLPTWEQLLQVKNLFIGEARTALQVLPAKNRYVNIHPGVLHLWHCLEGDVTPDFTAGGETI